LTNGENIRCYPFHLRIFFDDRELITEGDEVQRLERICTELVGEIHAKLLRLFNAAEFDRRRELQDAFILSLEQKIEELACTRKDFPIDDLTETPLGNHLAGVTVRSRLLHQLIGKAGLQSEMSEQQQKKKLEGWTRQRTALPDYEDRELPRLIELAGTDLKLSGADRDLTRQMKIVETRFWTVWNHMLRTFKPLTLRLRRYLALRRLREEIKFIWYGFGPLEDLLEDPTISDIMVVDDEHIFIDKAGRVENSGRRFLTDPMGIIRKIVNGAGREINNFSPMVDARMPDGSRVNAIVPPLALRGPCLTIRRFPNRRRTVEDLVRDGSLTPASCKFLQACVLNRRNLIVSGGTGTGKTTLLNCLSGFIPDKERIVTIEDTAELQLQKEHVVTLQARQNNAEGKGEVTIRDLVRNALRMRPDRIVVGEVRGGEAIDMLQAMNTGHDGSLTTIHANSPHDVVLRLEVMVQQNTETRFPVESVYRQIVSAVDLIIQLRHMNFGDQRKRVVCEISEVVSLEEDGSIRIVPLFVRAEGGPLRSTGHLATFLPALLNEGLIDDPIDLVRLG
jgi:Flp pilus assembly CpaF family ATPase